MKKRSPDDQPDGVGKTTSGYILLIEKKESMFLVITLLGVHKHNQLLHLSLKNMNSCFKWSLYSLTNILKLQFHWRGLKKFSSDSFAENWDRKRPEWLLLLLYQLCENLNERMGSAPILDLFLAETASASGKTMHSIESVEEVSCQCSIFFVYTRKHAPGNVPNSRFLFGLFSVIQWECDIMNKSRLTSLFELLPWYNEKLRLPVCVAHCTALPLSEVWISDRRARVEHWGDWGEIMRFEESHYVNPLFSAVQSDLLREPRTSELRVLRIWWWNLTRTITYSSTLLRLSNSNREYSGMRERWNKALWEKAWLCSVQEENKGEWTMKRGEKERGLIRGDLWGGGIRGRFTRKCCSYCFRYYSPSITLSHTWRSQRSSLPRGERRGQGR